MAQAAPSTTHATVEHGAKHGDGEFPPFNSSTYPGQLIWLALTFGFLFYAMSKMIVPRLGAILETRREVIARDLDEAAAMKARADEAGQAYEKALAEARANAQAIAQETRATLTAESDAQRKTLEADLSAKLAAAEASIAQKTADAMTNVRSIAADAAEAIVERLTGRAPDRTQIEAAFDRSAARN